MKRNFFKLSLLSCAVTASAWALTPGDQISIEALSQSDFVQGEAPQSWKQDEVYILECWATWCGPCIAAVPHVDELYDKFHEQGLTVIGMNVFEDGREKALNFVEKKGEGMSYPVAYVGLKGKFDETWLKAADVNSIPHAFVVKNGEYLFSAHPSDLTEELVIELLAGGDAAEARVGKIRIAAKMEQDREAAMVDFKSALGTKDIEGMQAAYEAASHLEADATTLAAMKVEITVAQKDWAETEKIVRSLGDDQRSLTSIRSVALSIDGEEVPEGLSRAILDRLKLVTSYHFLDDPIVARLHWSLGEKEQAQAVGAKMVERKSLIPKDILISFAASFETDKPQTMTDYSQAVREAMTKKAEAARAKKAAEKAAQ